ncbi:hypothetical protein NE236_25420 [Actinoallomurus purpureus]|uniref:hypothetical protein n=1 Tax=Actinoallomurus purpureus TaxID=478114 RepID=UPI00209200A3|nr:hypothetical protein [Actinoallomurus purpureus]MCO6008322.1 hypothetical protein [Actinoallomurus purpureus]
MIALPRNPHRFRLSRAGIHQVWQYDEEFLFGGGRLLLRGKNGAGKSKALEMLLPFLLDGDTRRLDAAGGGKTTLKWLMLDGWTTGTNRLGYLWVEFARTTEDDGADERLTLGVAVRASRSTGEAKPMFFVTSLAVGDDLPLHDPARRPTPAELRELVGPENCFRPRGRLPRPRGPGPVRPHRPGAVPEPRAPAVRAAPADDRRPDRVR